MLRADRGLTERLFSDWLLKVVLVRNFILSSTLFLLIHFMHRFFFQVLVCTTTLAWGVNLPAHTSVIKVGANLVLFFISIINDNKMVKQSELIRELQTFCAV